MKTMIPFLKTDNVTLYNSNCLSTFDQIPNSSINAIITDPPYAEINRKYGLLTEIEWHKLMTSVVKECRRILTPTGSAVFILQPNSEKVGRMRPWLWQFIANIAIDWNLIQDAYWWNICTPPTIHCQRRYGLMRPSVKYCVWAGSPNCYRNQDEVLCELSDATKRYNLSDRTLHRKPSGQSMRGGRCCSTAIDRGGSTPFNMLAMGNVSNKESGGDYGHGASTPLLLCEWWIKYISRKNETILDPFNGSGTVGVAAIKLNRQYIGIEKETKYCNISKKRLEKEIFKQQLDIFN